MKTKNFSILILLEVIICFCTINACADTRSLSKAEYLEITTLILRHEGTGGVPGRPDTVFVELDETGAPILAPELQHLYRASTTVKSRGNDLSFTKKNDCPYDKAMDHPATLIAISAPQWHGAEEVAFSVTFRGCATSSRGSTYVFKRNKSGHWEMQTVKPEFIS